MNDLFDYLVWRGDLTLKEAPFQEVDGLILTCLSYHFFQGVLRQYDTTPIKIETVAKRVMKLVPEKVHARDGKDLLLLQALGLSNRFKDMRLCCYVDYVNKEKEAQFSAITVLLDEKEIFVAYRGTDMSLVGWKEDMNMSFREYVPAQIAAACYLIYITDTLQGNIRIGGHSKGGNLGVFAAAVAPEKVKKRVKTVLNYDGPGFHDTMLNFSGYKEILPRVKAYIPESSVFGMMLKREETCQVIASKEKGIMQHDPYSWGILGTEFMYVDSISEGSKFLDKILKEWFDILPLDKRESFFQGIFQILSSTHEDEHGDLLISAKNAYMTLRTLKYEDEETKQAILEGFGLFGRAFFKTAGDYDLGLQKLKDMKLLSQKKPKR